MGPQNAHGAEELEICAGFLQRSCETERGKEACSNAQAAPREPVKRVAAVEGYRLWAPVYDCMQNPLLSVESRTLRRLLYRIRVQRVVDVACGTGRWMLHFQERG